MDKKKSTGFNRNQSNQEIYRRPNSSINRQPKTINMESNTSNRFNSTRRRDTTPFSTAPAYDPRIGMRKLEELMAKTPEDIILAFKDPRFCFDEYLNTERMGEALVHKLTLVLNKAFECNSIQVMMRNHVDKIVESVFFTRHLYDLVNARNDMLQHGYNLDLIELTILLCNRFLLLQPLCQPKLSAMKDRLELLIKIRMANSNPKLEQLFDEFVKFEKDVSER